MTISNKTIQIEKHIAADLALRDSADKFFDQIEKLKEQIIIVDFNNVKSISRSFAHQYYLRKTVTKKQIKEINLSKDIEKMFEIVEQPKPKTRLVEINKESICL